jgi:dienelactone hydrolase
MLNPFVRSKGLLKIQILFGVVFTLLYHSSIGQKPCLGVNADSTWTTLHGDYSLSNNGRNLYYSYGDLSADTTVVETTGGEWKVRLAGASVPAFTQDNRTVIFRRRDTLGLMGLEGGHQIQYITGISNSRVLKRGAHDDLLIYQRKGQPEETVIRDIGSGKERTCSHVAGYWLCSDGRILMLEIKEREGDRVIYQLRRLDLAADDMQPIWAGEKITGLAMDTEGVECVFSAADESDSGHKAIWLYMRGDTVVRKLIDDYAEGIDKGLHIGKVSGFNEQDRRIFFTLEEDREESLTKKSVPVDIWSYRDAQLQSQQLYELRIRGGPVTYKAALNIRDRKVIRLEGEHERVMSPVWPDKPMSYVLVERDGTGDVDDEWNWNSSAYGAVYLLSLKSESRVLLKDHLKGGIANFTLSYNEHDVFYYDVQSGNYYCYDIRTGSKKNMTLPVHEPWITYDEIDKPDSTLGCYPIAGIIKDEDGVLVYGRHDMFELDPAGKEPARDLTGGISHGHDVEIRLKDIHQYPAPVARVIGRHDEVVCEVFDRRDKERGLFRSRFDSLPGVRSGNLEPMDIAWPYLMKARDTTLYLANWMTAESSPNVYITQDFRTYSPVTNVHPEQGYNWMTAELIRWKSFDGAVTQGILYKPEDFDGKKKYPLLVYYYEQFSNGLHNFPGPEPSSGRLNIAMYVSNGYLVFTPDIRYKIGWPGRSAYNAVVSGVEYLSGRKYIDTRRMGLQGHSFGGYETNYIITHSHLFAAAMSASAVSDLISAYGSVDGGGRSRQSHEETGQGRIGATLWQRPDLYIENSPILRADQMTTPLLILANKNDGTVPYEQGIEFFTALRRLGKKAWMLQYDGEGHNVLSKAAQEDLTLRMAQFFNYYLKGDWPPEWMTVGVPASSKGVDSGLEIDRSGAKP